MDISKLTMSKINVVTFDRWRNIAFGGLQKAYKVFSLITVIGFTSKSLLVVKIFFFPDYRKQN